MAKVFRIWRQGSGTRTRCGTGQARHESHPASQENSQEWPELMPTLFRIICDANKDRSLTSIALFWCENDVVAFEVMKVMIKFSFGFETWRGFRTVTFELTVCGLSRQLHSEFDVNLLIFIFKFLCAVTAVSFLCRNWVVQCGRCCWPILRILSRRAVGKVKARKSREFLNSNRIWLWGLLYLLNTEEPTSTTSLDSSG